MNQRTIVFIAFVVFSLLMLVVGYVARRRRWCPEAWSRPIHLHTLVWFWAPVGLLSFWGMPLNEPEQVTQLLIVLAAQPILMLAAAAVMIAGTRAMGMDRPRTGVLVLGAALSNHGFTLGAYLCYATMEPADTALGYGVAYVTSMQVFMVLLFYPIAQHFSDEPVGSMGKLIGRSFLTLRATPLYAALVGLGLNLLDAPRPEVIDRFHVLHILFFASAVGSYGGIGLRLHVGDLRANLSGHGLLAGVQFLVHPALAVGLMALAGIAVPVDGLTQRVIVVEALMPTAINMVIVSNLFHLDARYGSQLWVVNTLLFCLLPLPVLLLWPG